MIDLRDPPRPRLDLGVFRPDLTTVIHASAGLAHDFLAQVALLIGGAGPSSFRLANTGRDGAEHAFDVHVVVPFGDGRPVVIEVSQQGPPQPQPAVVGPHPELAVALATVERDFDPAAALDTYLYCMLRATGTEGVVALRTDGDVATVLGAAGRTGLVRGQSYPAASVRTELPAVLAIAEPPGEDAIVARPATSPGSSGWLGDAALRATRSMHGPTTRSATHPDRQYASSGPRTVVYLDDDPGSVELLVEYFRLLPSLELVPVRNEREAHDAIARHRPAVVLVDAWLGDRSTDGLVREILAGSQLEVPAVAVLSADANASTVARFRRLGVTSYLSKPIELGHLFAVVDALARGDEREEGNESNARTTATFGN